MAKEKQHVLSARTTEEGLRLLNELRRARSIGWDALVIDAMCAHYNLDRAVMGLTKKEKPAKREQVESEQAPGEESAPEQPTATGQEQSTEKAPAKKNGKRGGKTGRAK